MYVLNVNISYLREQYMYLHTYICAVCVLFSSIMSFVGGRYSDIWILLDTCTPTY